MRDLQRMASLVLGAPARIGGAARGGVDAVMRALAIPDPFPRLDEALQALVDADRAGTTTDAHLVAVWWAVSPIRSKLPDDLGYRLTRAVEDRMSEHARVQCRRVIDECISARIAQAIEAGLPVFEEGGLIALAEADTALWRAAR
ncbi:MAG TPA: hypothetical protein VGE10_06770 [Zeimonas sp.]